MWLTGATALPICMQRPPAPEPIVAFGRHSGDATHRIRDRQGRVTGSSGGGDSYVPHTAPALGFIGHPTILWSPDRPNACRSLWRATRLRSANEGGAILRRMAPPSLRDGVGSETPERAMGRLRCRRYFLVRPASTIS